VTGAASVTGGAEETAVTVGAVMWETVGAVMWETVGAATCVTVGAAAYVTDGAVVGAAA